MQLRSTDLKRLHRDWRRRTDGRLALILDGVQSPFNVGAIVRTAAAMRVEVLYVAGGSTGPAHPQARRLSMGTERYLKVVEMGTGRQAVEAVRTRGFQVVALELTDSAVALHQFEPAADVCLVLGNEDHGLGRETLAAVDATAYIPQLGKVGSFNVATAAAIALYEMRRQEWAGAAGAGDPPVVAPPAEADRRPTEEDPAPPAETAGRLTDEGPPPL
ncbi:MAG TPA: TrmH family RNA methyltransferase [Acidimicrobiales bacterium]|nr:TrmH family RNA methyltransferase [Acidimicrobiales bacterium]